MRTRTPFFVPPPKQHLGTQPSSPLKTTMLTAKYTVLFMALGAHQSCSARPLLPDALAKQAGEPNCTEYTDLFSPQYAKCTGETENGIILDLLYSPWLSNFCLLVDGQPCRSTYLCENNETIVYTDCRNVYPENPDATSTDCDGNLLDPSMVMLDFDGVNGCSRVGWNCVGTFYDLASCYWYDILSDGTYVWISTNEPADQIGDPESLGYYGECFARVNSTQCSSCYISCIEENNNYATFDCSNLSSDPCAITGNCYNCAGPTPAPTTESPVTAPTPASTTDLPSSMPASPPTTDSPLAPPTAAPMTTMASVTSSSTMGTSGASTVAVASGLVVAVVLWVPSF